MDFIRPPVPCSKRGICAAAALCSGSIEINARNRLEVGDAFYVL